MSAPAPERTLHPATLRHLIIAGWTGRDSARVAAHVRELEAEGIPRPPRTPMFYALSADLLTTAADITVVGGSTSGEVECLLVSRDDGLWVGTRVGPHRPRARAHQRCQVETGVPQARRERTLALFRRGAPLGPARTALVHRRGRPARAVSGGNRRGDAASAAAHEGPDRAWWIVRAGNRDVLRNARLAVRHSPVTAIRDGAARPGAWPHAPPRVSRARTPRIAMIARATP